MSQPPIFKHLGAVALAGSFLLGGCAGTPLEDPAAGRNTSPGAATSTTAQSAVAPVTAANPVPETSGPANVSRLVYFDYESASIRPEFRPIIDAHARFLAAHRERKLTIAGHTDERGGREYNLALGQQRADAVRQAMQLLGAGQAQVETISFGEEKPAASGGDETAWSRNRRAEMSYQ